MTPAPSPQVIGLSGSLRILRVADVARVATAGMSGFMLSSAAEMERSGHRVSFWFHDHLIPQLTSPRLRRLLLPWLIVAKVGRTMLADERFDIIEIHEPLAGPYALVARLARRLGLPACAVMSHGLEERGWQAQIEHLLAYGRKVPWRSRVVVPLTLLSQARLAVRQAETVLVTSSIDRDYLLSRLGVPPERVSCCFTGVSHDMFGVRRVSHDGVRVLFIGSWIERKGVSELMAAWRRLATERPNVSLTVCGVGDPRRARADLDHIARDHIARVEVIESVGREKLADLLGAHDLFVLPSWFEGMPMSMLEAAGAALPCVVCAVCGNLDVFRVDDPQRDGGILIPPNDADALFAALVTLVDDAQLRATLGARARDRAHQFTWANNANRTLNAYAAAIQRQRSGRR